MVIGPTIEDVIERVSLFRDREVTALPLSGGHMNTVFLVRADDVKYVVRVPGPSSELLAVDRANERHNAEAAAAAGVSPRVLEYLDDWNVMVLEYVEGKTMSAKALGSFAQIPRICESLRKLHAGPRFLTDFDMFSTTERWLRVCDEREITGPAGLRERMAQLRDVQRASPPGGPGSRARRRLRRVPLRGTEVRLDGPDGEIQLRGPTLMEGYRHDPDATARAFTVDGWLRTADLGSLDDDGRVTVHGRRDDAIRSGGETVWPDEVERALVDHPKIRSVAVAGRADPDWGEHVTAWVSPPRPTIRLTWKSCASIAGTGCPASLPPASSSWSTISRRRRRAR